MNPANRSQRGSVVLLPFGTVFVADPDHLADPIPVAGEVRCGIPVVRRGEAVRPAPPVSPSLILTRGHDLEVLLLFHVGRPHWQRDRAADSWHSRLSHRRPPSVVVRHHHYPIRHFPESLAGQPSRTVPLSAEREAGTTKKVVDRANALIASRGCQFPSQLRNALTCAERKFRLPISAWLEGEEA